MQPTFNRRVLLASAGAAAASLTTGRPLAANEPAVPTARRPRFRYSLNTSTIRGQKKSLPEIVEIAAKTGYDGIEPWIREIQDYVRGGGKLNDLKKRITDVGLTVVNAIGFAAWIVDDDAARAKGLESARRDMDLVRQIGGSRIAAPPVGATRQSGLNLFKAAERYRALLQAGRKIGVTPQLEVWGFSRSLSRLGEVLLVAAESGDSDACILPDVYHIYKGGSAFTAFDLIAGNAIHVFHMNDYPADPPRAKISDADRVYPGDGVAPLPQLLRSLKRTGFAGALSLELFNRRYWKQDALAVAGTGLRKMKAAVEKAG